MRPPSLPDNLFQIPCQPAPLLPPNGHAHPCYPNMVSRSPLSWEVRSPHFLSSSSCPVVTTLRCRLLRQPLSATSLPQSHCPKVTPPSPSSISPPLSALNSRLNRPLTYPLPAFSAANRCPTTSAIHPVPFSRHLASLPPLTRAARLRLSPIAPVVISLSG